jgi:hypothetical protein
VLVRLRRATGSSWSAWVLALLLAVGLSWFQAIGPASDPTAAHELELLERIWEGDGVAPQSRVLRW